MNDLRKRFSNLIMIKSLLTLALTGVFCYLSVIGVISGELFMTVYTTVVAFYFGTQAKKE